MQSTRLPGKVLMPLPFPAGHPILGHIIDQAKKIAGVTKVIVATSNNIENDPIESYCKEREIRCFRGSENNVLSRFVQIAQSEKFDHIIRLTGDNPLLDLDEIESTLKTHIENRNDYTYSKGLPLGMNIEVARSNSIIESFNQNDLTPSDYEHVTLYLKRKQNFQKQEVELNSSLASNRFTIDYPEDYAFMSLIFSYFDTKKYIPNPKKLSQLFNLNPWLFSINDKLEQKQVFNGEEEELRYSFSILKKLGLETSASVLTQYLKRSET